MRTSSSVLLTVALVATSALTGCEASIGTEKTVKVDEVQTTIAKIVTDQAGVRVKSVTCPKKIVVKAGATFTCTVEGRDASKGDALATQKDDKGNFRVSAPFLHPRDVEQKIADGIRSQTSLKTVTITCPEITVAKTGGTFECAADGEGGKAQVAATQTNDTGGFDYKIVNGAGG